jgi:23S rRNA pseudouridine1911/1915/1917 synthase
MASPGVSHQDRGEEAQVPPEHAGLRLDQALARLFPGHSRSRLAAWVREGRVLLDSRVVAPDEKVWGGEVVELRPLPDPRTHAPQAQAIALRVVHEDAAVLVIDKPAGLVVHPGSGNWDGTLLNALLHRAPALADIPRAGIVHRLDKDTSGLLVVAKTLTAQTSLVRQLQAREVERIYLAIARGEVLNDGEVEAPIGRDPRNRVRMAVVATGKPALTRFRVIARYPGATLLECRLATGRTHQIRVHLQSLGHPLVGDPVYRGPVRAGEAGGPHGIAFGRQALHATRLAFMHPVDGRRVAFESPLPADIAALIALLETDEAPSLGKTKVRAR